MSKIVMIDYGAGNIRSAFKAFEHLGADIELTSNTAVVQRDPRGQIKFVQGRYWATAKGANTSGLFGLIIGTIFSGQILSRMAGISLNAFLGQELSQTFMTDIQNDLAPQDTILLALQSTPNDTLLRPFVPPESTLHTTTLTIEVPSALSQALAGYTD
ncbi:MAG: hypothetical protein KDD89_00635 [Anaerolineales bacterium]|nr:hypothetical protein [Anaerolineales bacterium]